MLAVVALIACLFMLHRCQVSWLLSVLMSIGVGIIAWLFFHFLNNIRNNMLKAIEEDVKVLAPMRDNLKGGFEIDMEAKKPTIGYINNGKDPFVFTVDDFTVKMVSCNPDINAGRRAIGAFVNSNHFETYITGYTPMGNGVAFLLCEKLGHRLSLRNEIMFNTPIIVKSAGVSSQFYDNLNYAWNQFHCLFFYGGCINVIKNPKDAIIDNKGSESRSSLNGDEIVFKPSADYEYSLEVAIKGVDVNITISYLKEYDLDSSQRAFGFLDSYISFSFEEAQELNIIMEYYRIVHRIIAILTRQGHADFNAKLKQINKNGAEEVSSYLFFKNLNRKPLNFFAQKVIPIDYFFVNSEREQCFKNLIQTIVEGEAEHILRLVDNDTRETGYLHVDDIKVLMTALEVEYNKSSFSKIGDEKIEELKTAIKHTISEFIAKYPEFDPYEKTNISSAFQYLDYTLKKKIFELYNNYKTEIDEVVRRTQYPEINLENIGKIVRIRHRSTHDAKVSWNDSEILYKPLVALVYASFFTRMGCSEIDVGELISMLF